MPYGTIAADTIQSSTAITAPIIKDGNSVEIGKFVKGWLNYNGTSPNIYSSFNISSVTKNTTGNYSISYTNAIVANHALSGTTDYTGVTGNQAITIQQNVGAGTGSTTGDQFLGIAYDGSAFDNTGFQVIIIG